MNIRDRFKVYHGNFGLKGLVAITGYRLVRFPTRVKVHCSGIAHPVQLRIGTSDIALYESILRSKEYEFDLPFFPRTIVDAGANIGMASVFFANRYPGARIIAVEPERSNFEALCRNCEPYQQITPVHAALWNRDGSISVGAPDPETGAGGHWAFVTCEGPGEQVRSVTVRTLMRQMGLSSIDIFKMDIEGSEKEVFSSCDWVGSVRCLMVELHDRFKPGCTEAAEAATLGFSRLQRGETTLYTRGGI